MNQSMDDDVTFIDELLLVRVVALDPHYAAVNSSVWCDRHETRSASAARAKVIACRKLAR